MKKFRFKYSLTVWLLLALVVALSVAGMVWNIFNIKEYLWAGPLKITAYAMIVAITAFLAIFALSIMIFCFYDIDKEFVRVRFGLVQSKISLSDIVQITHFKKSDKLVVYFKTQKYAVIVISPLEYDSFINAIRSANPKILYSAEIDGEDTPN